VAQPSYDFKDRVVVVTGGSSDAGAGIVSAFVGAGAHVVTCGTKPAEVEGAVFVIADVRQADQARQVIDTASQRFGRVDVLINSAGGWPDMTPGPSSPSPRAIDAIVALNLLAPFYCSQAANDFMVGQTDGGVIVNVAGASGLEPSADDAAYGAANAGLRNLTTSLAVEWAPKVRVNFVGFERSVVDDRAAGPADMAQACLFLASAAARSITGANLVVGGGA
jgi:NAD(P)-dependent dehydrogenase (short-subunit alcohol dehydrogenase family)